MTVHPLVVQLRFTRSEFARCFAGVSDADARIRLMPMNCLSWILGHLANQENGYWVRIAQGKVLRPGLRDLVGYGKPASTPPLDEMWDAWHEITAAADVYLDTLTPTVMQQFFKIDGKEIDESIGTLLQRNLYHYWYHTGEAAAIRQQLGHKNLPEYVGDMANALYQPEKE